MAMRVTGMYSGLETDSIIQELVAARQTKVDALKKEQTTLEWKQEAWKTLNTKIFNLYNNTLSDMRYQSSYMKKTTSVSNSSVASVLTSDGAMNSVQSLKVSRLAKSGYLTGGKVETSSGGKVGSSTKLKDMGIEEGTTFQIKSGSKTTDITVTKDMKMSDLVNKLQSAGVNANFDASTQRMYVGAKDSGKSSDFNFSASNLDGLEALDKLGLMSYDDSAKAVYQEYADMVNTDSAAAQALIADLADSMALSYKSQYDGLTTKIDEAKEKLESILAKYDETGDRSDLIALANDPDAVTALEDELAGLKEIEAPSEEQTARMEEIQGQLDSLSEYKSQVAATEDLIFEQAAIGGKFTLQDDGTVTAGDDVIADATKVIADKIAVAAQKVNSWDEDSDGTRGAVKIDGQDAEIYLNGAKFTSNSNVFDINGLTITCNAETVGDEEVTLTTQNDVSGIYDMVKNFLKEYNDLINEFDTLYNTKSSKDIKPLTDEEKDAMSESEIEAWEKKIKDSLLYKDSTLNGVSSAFKSIMADGYTVNGKKMYLFDLGIDKMGYFEAEDNQRNAYYINGDSDSSSAIKNKENTLMNMITKDPDAVMEFFTQMSKALYEKTTELGKNVKDYSSLYTVYEDKKMKTDYDNYTSKIKEQEKKLQAYEDKWYSKFSAMEVALAKMQSNANAITGLLGGGS